MPVAIWLFQTVLRPEIRNSALYVNMVRPLYVQHELYTQFKQVMTFEKFCVGQHNSIAVVETLHTAV